MKVLLLNVAAGHVEQILYLITQRFRLNGPPKCPTPKILNLFSEFDIPVGVEHFDGSIEGVIIQLQALNGCVDKDDYELRINSARVFDQFFNYRQITTETVNDE